MIDSLGSGVLEPALEKLTVSGTVPSVLFAEATATGGRWPFTYENLNRLAAGLIWKNPVP